MNREIIKILISFLIAILIWAVIILGYKFLGSTLYVQRIFETMGGNALNGGYIQFITYFFFIYAMIDIVTINRMIGREEEILDKSMLPEATHKVINSGDVMDLKHKSIALEAEQGSSFFLTQLIIRACTKFRSNESVPEVIETTIRQSQLDAQRLDSNQSMLRYIAWVIPSIGFIGTVLGISSGIGAANGEMETEDIEKVTSMLGVAFDTTLIALFLSVILMYLLYRLQSRSELLHNSIEQYVLDNLVNRIQK